jgi:hypothetical protein
LVKTISGDTRRSRTRMGITRKRRIGRLAMPRMVFEVVVRTDLF